MKTFRNRKSFAVSVFFFILMFGAFKAYAADPSVTLDSNAFRCAAFSANAIAFERSDVLPSGTPLDAAGSGSIIGRNEGNGFRVISTGDIYAPASCMLLFDGFSCSSVSFDNFNTSEVTDMTGMFQNCSSLRSLDGIGGWNTSSLRSIRGMFNYCSSLTSLDLSGWNTSNVDNMSMAFQCCSSLTDLNGISGWNTSGVADLSYMFYGCSRLSSIDVSGWNTSNVISLESTFCGLGLESPAAEICIAGLANWNTGNCITLAHLFMNGADNTGSGKLTNESLAGVAGWNVSRVTDMTSLFYGQGVNLTALDLSRWDVSSVRSMNHMFADCRRLERLDLSNWNVGSLETVCNMFDDCYALRTVGDISHWKTAHLIDISGFLNGCTSFDGCGGQLDLSGWDTSSIKGAQEVFRAIRVSSINLSGWNLSGVTGAAWDGAGAGIHYAYSPESCSIEEMFLDCAELTSVTTDSSWSLASSVSTRNIFTGCSSLAAADMERIMGAA